MAAFTPDIALDVVTACRGSAEEIVAALTRAFDGQLIGVTVHEATTYDARQPPSGFDGAGLAVIFKCADTSAVAVIPESSGLLPTWYRQPDPTGKSKLSTLAQELSMLLLPASHIADEYHIVPLDQLAASLARAELAAGAPLVPITIKHAGKEGQISVLWPVAKQGELLPKQEPATTAAPQKAHAEAKPAVAEDSRDDDFARLPRYARSFLKVQVPVSVNLASQKLTVQEICELVPGAIIKFDKSCEEMLDLAVCDQPIAAGEVVKVGDKFGLRIRNMILPHEQFIAIQATMAS
jgi:flagellar motor switch protein FliN